MTLARTPVPAVGDRVVMLTSPRGEPGPSSDQGLVVRVSFIRHGSGGNRAMLRVRWDRSQHEGRVQERMVAVIHNGGPLYELRPGPGREWTPVDVRVFRSWTGERRINGEPYDGPVYVFGSNDKAAPPRKS